MDSLSSRAETSTVTATGMLSGVHFDRESPEHLVQGRRRS